MIAEALEYLRKHLGQGHETEILDPGSTYFDREFYPCPLPTGKPDPHPVRLHTLSGLARFTLENVDELTLESHILHASAACVELIGPLSTTHRRREKIATANYQSGVDNILDSLMPLERLLPKLEVFFEQNDDRDRLIALLSDVDVTAAEKRVKQGLGYEVKAMRGVGGKGWQDVDKPFELLPYRSFPEAGRQVLSRFILDLDVQKAESGNTVSVRLREVDGKAWVPRAGEQVGKAIGAMLADVAPAGQYVPTVVW